MDHLIIGLNFLCTWLFLELGVGQITWCIIVPNGPNYYAIAEK